MLTFESDVIPTPTANFSAPHPLFPTLPEQQNARQPLELLDKDIIRNQGQSASAHRAFKNLKPCLDQGAITEL